MNEFLYIGKNFYLSFFTLNIAQEYVIVSSKNREKSSLLWRW